MQINPLFFFSLKKTEHTNREFRLYIDYGFGEVDDGYSAAMYDAGDGTIDAGVENVDSYYDAGVDAYYDTGVDAYYDAGFNEDFDGQYDNGADEGAYVDSGIYYDDADYGHYDYDADVVELDATNLDYDDGYGDENFHAEGAYDDTYHDKGYILLHTCLSATNIAHFSLIYPCPYIYHTFRNNYVYLMCIEWKSVQTIRNCFLFVFFCLNIAYNDYEYDTGGENLDENAGFFVADNAYYDDNAGFDEYVEGNDIEFNDEDEVKYEVADGYEKAEDAEVENTFDIEAGDDITDAATVAGITVENIESETVESVGTKIVAKTLFKSPMIAVIGVVSLVLLIINILVCVRHQCKKPRGITTWAKVDTISSASDSEENELL